MSAWSGHLNGIHRLFSLLDIGSAPDTQFVSQELHNRPSDPHMAQWWSPFWYFLRNDMEESCKRGSLILNITD